MKFVVKISAIILKWNESRFKAIEDACKLKRDKFRGSMTMLLETLYYRQYYDITRAI